MRTLLLGAVALVAICGSALATDLPARPVYRAPAPVVPVYNWTGFYLGAGWGYGMYNIDTTWFNPAGGTFLPLTQTEGGRGWLGTVTLGFDYQFNSAIVGGVFADYDVASIKGTIQNQGPFTVGTLTENSAWAVGARVGLLVTPAILSYVNAGYTQASFSSASMIVNIPPNTGLPLSTIPSQTYKGWFVGSGVEANFAPGWFWRNEYRFASYGSQTLPDVSNATGLPISLVSVKPYVQTVRSEIIYKFNWSAPVAARY